MGPTPVGEWRTRTPPTPVELSREPRVTLIKRLPRGAFDPLRYETMWSPLTTDRPPGGPLRRGGIMALRPRGQEGGGLS